MSGAEEHVDESRDVSNIDTNEGVEREVDNMLDVQPEDRQRDESDEQEDVEPRPEIQETIDEAQERQETEVEVSTVADESEDWEDFDFEGQDFDQIESKDPEIVEVGPIAFKLAEPDTDDEVLNKLDGMDQGSDEQRMRAMADIVVEAPKLTTERWNKLRFSQKMQLVTKASEFLGLDEDFLEV